MKRYIHGAQSQHLKTFKELQSIPANIKVTIKKDNYKNHAKPDHVKSFYELIETLEVIFLHLSGKIDDELPEHFFSNFEKKVRNYVQSIISENKEKNTDKIVYKFKKFIEKSLRDYDKFQFQMSDKKFEAKKPIQPVSPVATMAEDKKKTIDKNLTDKKLKDSLELCELYIDIEPVNPYLFKYFDEYLSLLDSIPKEEISSSLIEKTLNVINDWKKSVKKYFVNISNGTKNSEKIIEDINEKIVNRLGLINKQKTG